jgi:predicted kinase
MTTLHLMVGLPCSGKTTLSRKLEADLNAIRLNLDEWHIRLFGQDALHPDHDERHTQIERMLWEVARRLLELGVDVILDYGLWARAERDEYRRRAKNLGADTRIHFMDVQEEELICRLRLRNDRPMEDCFVISEESLRSWIPRFEAPSRSELSSLE